MKSANRSAEVTREIVCSSRGDEAHTLIPQSSQSLVTSAATFIIRRSVYDTLGGVPDYNAQARVKKQPQKNFSRSREFSKSSWKISEISPVNSKRTQDAPKISQDFSDRSGDYSSCPQDYSEKSQGWPENPWEISESPQGF